jgi:uncharacterized protein (TIGR02680 family)
MKNPYRYRFSRAGVRNVWQYDEQEFAFAGGRLLLRGTNGAGKSKTLEMLLPFVLDGDSGALDATGRRGAGLVWLMDQGRSSDSGSRLGYVWVELTRKDENGVEHARTFGVGLRLSPSAKQVTKWFFSTTRRIGEGLALDGPVGMLTTGALRDELGEDGSVFERAAEYRAHVGRILFGLDVERYDELLRLLYWLRRPQVGEEIDPRKIATMLSQALPALPEDTTRTIGATLDELTAFGEKIARREDALAGLQNLAGVYRRYSTGVLAGRSHEVTTAATAHSSAQRKLRGKTHERDEHERALAADRASAEVADTALRSAGARLEQLERGPGADRRKELELRRDALRTERSTVDNLALRSDTEHGRATRSRKHVGTAGGRWRKQYAELEQSTVKLAESAARLGAGALTVPKPTDLPAGDDAAAATEHLAHTSTLWEHVVEQSAAVGSGLAQVGVVLGELDTALGDAQSAEQTASNDQQQAEKVENAAERKEGLLADAQRKAAAAEKQHLRQVAQWTADPRSDELDARPLTERDAWDTAAIQGLRAATDELTTTHLDSLGARRAAEQNIATTARTELNAFIKQRERVAAERDPSPPGPSWLRRRTDGIGVPLWRLVDARPGLSDTDRAGIEAALEAAGLLDALVLPDGTALDPGSLDVVIVPGSPTHDRGLHTLLQPEPGSPVAQERVQALLESIATTGDGPAVIGTDGSFALGPLRGRSSKPVAQYLGASARAAERLRRLAELDTQIADTREREKSAEQHAKDLGDRLEALRAWLNATPDGHEVLDAWRALDGATTARDEARVAAEEAARTAERSRRRFVELTERARTLATTAGVSPERDAVRSRVAEVAATRTALGRLPRETARSLEQLQTWRDAVTQLADDVASAEQAAAAAATARSALEVAEASYEAAKSAADPELRELDAKISAASEQKRMAASAVERLQHSVQALIGTRATAAEQVNTAQSALTDAEMHAQEAASALRQLAGVTGLIDAAVTVTEPSIRTTLLSAPEGAALVALARHCQQLVAEQPTATVNELHQAGELARTTPAADLDPRLLVEHDELWSAQAELGGTQAPITAVVENLAARVAEDRALLSGKERRLFEVHLLGDLGEALRTRLAEAGDLIAATNRILNDVKTSQGIRVRIDWAVRDDADAGTAEAVRLLLRMSQLSGAERDRLRELMHGIIESSRAAAPEKSYTEHLATALDYRLWYTVTVRITRPEWTGTFRPLTSRTGLSQGEQKVVCYLPLFAAAAAHFTSLAGASAPHAPRFILLDDAFPKIDVRTHPLLFGLLVDLDLDFVITSERLWGDTERVPSLAIYETLRAPGEIGVAQYHYHWDGTRRHALGDA